MSPAGDNSRCSIDCNVRRAFKDKLAAMATLRTIPLLLLLCITPGIAHAQPAPTRPVVVGAPLAQDELRQITGALGTPRAIWAIKHEQRGGLGGNAPMATVYFIPEVQTSALRRGRFATVAKVVDPRDRRKTVWRRLESQAWAQVALPGKPFGKDLGKPADGSGCFVVAGPFPDRKLVDVVQFILGLPPSERTSRGMKDFPIEVIQINKKGEVVVFEGSVEGDQATTQEVKLSRHAGSWKIESVTVSKGIAD